jgi:endonuclease/exonuclease/phosphatase family metal-dependent hydrolase
MTRNQRDIVFDTVNLFNLQLPGRPMYPTSRPYTEEQYAAKIAWTAETLKRLDADVIAFQELWSREALEAAFAAAGLAASYQLAFIKDEPWDGIAVAAVRAPWELRARTRHKAFPDGFRLKKRKRSMADIQADPPAADLAAERAAERGVNPESLPSHEDDEMKVKIDEFSRSPIQITVGHSRAGDVEPIEVFCAHLKSKLPTRLDDEEFRDQTIRPHASALGAALSTIRLTAEAAALRIILNETMIGNHRPTVVLGDLNDDQLSNTLDVLTDQPSYRVYADSTAARRNDDGLYSVATMQQLRSLSDVYYTHEFKGTRLILDHVLVSEQFYEHSENRLWSFREMKVWNDFIEDDDGATSDHGVLRAVFDWLPAR